MELVFFLICKKIKFSINNDEIDYEIEIDKSRKIYTNDKSDITIIEIKKLDKIDYLEIKYLMKIIMKYLKIQIYIYCIIQKEINKNIQ